MKRIIRLTESDLTRIVKRVIKEGECVEPPQWLLSYKINNKLGKSDCSNWEWRKDTYTFLWISLKDKLLILSVSPDDALLNTFKPILGDPKITEKYYTFKYNFSNQESGGDLNRVLDKLQGKIPWISQLKESDLTRIVKRLMSEEVDQLSDLKKLMRKNDDQSLEDAIEEKINHAFKNLDPKAFKTLEKYSTELSALVSYKLLPKFMFNDNVTKKYDARDFLINYIKKKYSSKFKKHYNN